MTKLYRIDSAQLPLLCRRMEDRNFLWEIKRQQRRYRLLRAIAWIAAFVLALGIVAWMSGVRLI